MPVVDHAAALADALEKAELLEWVSANGERAWLDAWARWDGKSDFAEALRAAKEAADAK